MGARRRLSAPTRASLRTGRGDMVEDLIWSYQDPISEAAKKKGLLAFFNEKVDLEVDGEIQERPQDAMVVGGGG